MHLKDRIGDEQMTEGTSTPQGGINIELHTHIERGPNQIEEAVGGLMTLVAIGLAAVMVLGVILTAFGK